MYIKNRDRQIIDHIYKYGFITTKQTELIFFKNNKNAYKEACRRLKILYENKLIFKTSCSNDSENVYILKENKQPSKHSILLMDFYAKLLNLGCEIIDFKREYTWFTNKRGDAYIEFKFGKLDCCPRIVEIDFSHATSIDKKYMPIFESEILQKKYKELYGAEMFPRICIVSTSSDQKYNGFFDVAFLDDKLTNFPEKVLSI